MLPRQIVLYENEPITKYYYTEMYYINCYWSVYWTQTDRKTDKKLERQGKFINIDKLYLSPKNMADAEL